MVELESSIIINLKDLIGKVNSFVLGQFIEHAIIPKDFEIDVSGAEFNVRFPKYSLLV